MKKNAKELFKIGILVPAMVLSLAACGASGTADAKATDQSVAEEAAAAEEVAAEDNAEAVVEEAAKTAEAAEQVYENGGFKLTVPADMAGKVTVETPEKSEDGVIFDVYETASVEAAKALGEEGDGLGWLFAICTRDADSAHEIMMNSVGGEDVIASDADGNYYVFYSPTDVRYERETPEQMEADQADWSAACEWADSVKKSFTVENSGLTPISFGGTQVEQLLARVEYGKDIKYTVSTLEFGPLEPGDVDPVPYIEKLMAGATFEYADGVEAPDGEYAVLMLPEQDYRIDFFFAEGSENMIRVNWNGEENTELYRVTYEDGETKASAIMQEWYDAIATAQGLK